MRRISKEEKKMHDWDNELRFSSANYTDIQVVTIACNAIEFAYEAFKVKEDVYEGFLYQYESKIENVALGIDAHLQMNAKNKKSQLIKEFVLDVVNTEKYGGGRSGFVFLLYVLKMDEELRTIAINRKDFWEDPRIQFQLLYSLFKRNITGFSKEAETLVENNPKQAELKKYARKYLEKC